MVKVVGHNSRFNVDCDRCGNKLQYTRDDVKPGDYVGDGEYGSVIICPCGKKISVTMQMGTLDAQAVERFRQQELRDDF